jgi:hypothetical protein
MKITPEILQVIDRLLKALGLISCLVGARVNEQEIQNNLEN